MTSRICGIFLVALTAKWLHEVTRFRDDLASEGFWR